MTLSIAFADRAIVQLGRRYLCVAMVALAALACLSTAARAEQRISATMKLVPYSLNKSTTIIGDVRITTPDGGVPSPLTGIYLRTPRGISFTSNGMGLAACNPARFVFATLKDPARVCPPDSLMGFGHATAEVPLGGQLIKQVARAWIVNVPNKEGRTTLGIFTESRSPILFESLFQGELLSTPNGVETYLTSRLPPVPTVPDGPDVALTDIELSLGPLGITYYEHVKGKLISFAPRGILLPPTCPHGGFHFFLRTDFLDGTSASTTNGVPCPRHREIRKRHGLKRKGR